MTKDKDLKDVVRAREPRSTVWQKSLLTQYQQVLSELKDTLKRCPDDRWSQSLWVVKKHDNGAWPIHRGLGADLPDDERLQLQSAFWNIAYHAIFHIDYYLSGGWTAESFEPPAPFREDDHYGGLPAREYTRDELLVYLELCKRKAAATLKPLTDEGAEKKVHQGQPFAELLIGNLLHAKEHQAQLAMFLSDV